MSADTTAMWCVPHLKQMGLLRATYSTYAYKRHFHDYYAVGVIEDGVQTFSCGRSQFINPSGGIFIIAPGEAHDGQSATEHSFTYSVFYPQASDLQQIASQMGVKIGSVPDFKQAVIEDVGMGQALLRLHQNLRQDKLRLEQESGFIDTFARLLERYAAQRPVTHMVRRESRTVARLRQYIDEHYADDILLSDLAQHVHWSPFYLLRVFRQEVGLPPHAYLESVRIRAAQRHLEQGMPLAQIAYETGFSSQSHLTNAFKRFIGTTPGRYRAIFCKTGEGGSTYTH